MHSWVFLPTHVGNSMIFYVNFRPRGDTKLILIISLRFTVHRKTVLNIVKLCLNTHYMNILTNIPDMSYRMAPPVMFVGL
jgi:hypothetical protein